ncbi:hypothetical protein [Endozoicomonas elysicola]|uniref:Uncharacterized protein n=1 Tax=Endozoicomonas elysicola TaxID=305900 RepID=A0A081KET0_9GAMM|nr:hypothetical protein [Endozoicomonas elysicola]KEI72656.1 hypothetical protein GV64_19685 [Endozoicomonas elysicola]
MSRLSPPLLVTIYVILVFSIEPVLAINVELNTLPDDYLSDTYTELIREAKPGWWGNWSLSKSVELGAIGVVGDDSSFNPSGLHLSNLKMKVSPLSEKLKVSTQHVLGPNVVSTNMAAGPAETSAQVTLKWEFSAKGAMSAQWILVEEQHLSNSADSIIRNMEFLKSVAREMNMLNPLTGEISQGFGVITGVILAKSGVNLASVSDSAEWSISGEGEGLQGMLGNANAFASYASAESSSNIVSVLWPATPNEVTDELVPIAYTFTSIHGETVIPLWVEKINDFELIFKNHSSYIVIATVSYHSSEGRAERQTKISGFLQGSIGDIPLDATSLKLRLEFVGSVPYTTLHNRWNTPLGTWLTGKRHIDVWGLWPDHPSFTIQEEE